MNGGAFSRKPGARSSSSSWRLAPGLSERKAAEQITLSMKVVAPGIMVMAIIYFMGAVGGAHLNPRSRWRSRRGAIFLGTGSRDISRRRPAGASRRLASCGRCSARQVYSAPRRQVRD